MIHLCYNRLDDSLRLYDKYLAENCAIREKVLHLQVDKAAL